MVLKIKVFSMNYLWFSWKDVGHPEAGGAERLVDGLLGRLADDGNKVRLITARYKNSKSSEFINGYEVFRVGGKYSVYWKVYRFYKKNFMGWADLVVDEVNTIPFFSKFYVREKSIIFFHQLCRKIWFYQIIWPLNLLGYLLEPVYLWVLNKSQVITVSNSTKKDLVRYGFKGKNIFIIPEFISLKPIERSLQKIKIKTIIAFGSVRKMKRTHHILKAYEMVRKEIKGLKLVIVGSANSKYGKSFLNKVKKSKYKEDITYYGFVDEKKKIELLRASDILCHTSVKEGWGLVVTEASSQGLPAVVYNVDGLRDSVVDGKTGLVIKENYQELAKAIFQLMRNERQYLDFQSAGIDLASRLTLKNSYTEFKLILDKIL